MSGGKEPTSPSAGTGANTPCDRVVQPCPRNKYKLIALTLTVAAPNNKFLMNNPEQKFEALASVTYIKTADANDLAALPTMVKFSFTDPSTNNMTKVASHQYTAGKYLGKRSDPSAILWEAHAANSATSDDAFKQTVKVTATDIPLQHKMTAKVYFKPAGAGGDDYKLRAAVLAANGTTELLTQESSTIVVWREVTFRPYEMHGQTHVSTHGTTAIMAGYYTNATFVTYTLGAVTNIAAAKSVKYIGLWDHATTSQLNWTTHKAKIPAETPTVAETTAANGAAGPAQITARAAIQTKANAWRDRINTAYTSGLNNWATDAAVPVNSIVSIEYEHPKYSASAPNADSVTSEWSTYPWLIINVEGSNIHPDTRWISGQGLSYGQRAYITAGMSAARTKVAIAHEAGHETKNQFKRKTFGAGDHTAGAGLMDPTGSRSSFAAGEIEILKGKG
ncbi:MAG: hypothetical protein SRB2_03933 [Desulfobacteraceae bacterium Eth-SRB2]|nr:MAG: hypothetical protein SRB2_03933 [Desulfobacteraceae bacterium Eth-SRB2]